MPPRTLLETWVPAHKGGRRVRDVATDAAILLRCGNKQATIFSPRLPSSFEPFGHRFLVVNGETTLTLLAKWAKTPMGKKVRKRVDLGDSEGGYLLEKM